MSKKLVAAVVAGILAFGSAMGAGVATITTSKPSTPAVDDLAARVRVLEVQRVDFIERLNRIEEKLDRLIERR